MNDKPEPMNWDNPEEVKATLKEFAALALRSLTDLKPRVGSGMYLIHDPKEPHILKTEHWMEGYKRALEKVGVDVDEDLLNFSRANKAERKKMLQDPVFKEKYEKANSKQ